MFRAGAGGVALFVRLSAFGLFGFLFASAFGTVEICFLGPFCFVLSLLSPYLRYALLVARVVRLVRNLHGVRFGWGNSTSKIGIFCYFSKFLDFFFNFLCGFKNFVYLCTRKQKERPLVASRRDAGVVDRAALEMRCTGNCTGGSNPSLSAKKELSLCLGSFFVEREGGKDEILPFILTFPLNPPLKRGTLLTRRKIIVRPMPIHGIGFKIPIIK